MHYKETEVGFEWGGSKVERHCSDKKKGWVILGLITEKSNIQIYVTKTGKVRLYDHKTGEEFFTKEEEAG